MVRPLPRLSLATQLIGVDGGASGVRAYEVELVETPSGRSLVATQSPSARDWPATPGFVSPAARGVERLSDLPPIDLIEQEQAAQRIETTARCVLEIARARGAARVLVGIALPGVKTLDGRGVLFARNGPRMPDFTSRLELLLASEGLELASGIGRLHSDGWCAGLGEEYARDGMLRGAGTVYYLAGGTGLAEALKLDGQLLSSDAIDDWFPRAWTLREPFEGKSYDDTLSARGLNGRWFAASGVAGRPEEHVADDARAQELFEHAGRCLATLVIERVLTLRARGPDAAAYPGPHELARVIVGQRLGQLLADERSRPWFERAYCEFAQRLLEERRLHGVHWTTHISSLRSAPALGAAASALFDALGEF